MNNLLRGGCNLDIRRRGPKRLMSKSGPKSDGTRWV